MKRTGWIAIIGLFVSVATGIAGPITSPTVQFAFNDPTTRSGSGGEFGLRVTQGDGGDLDGVDFGPSGLGYVPGVTMDVGTLSFPVHSLPAGVTWSDFSFQTFCIERNQHISLGGHNPYDVGPGAIPGGITGPNPDLISLGTAHLYYDFARGLLPDSPMPALSLYDYDNSDGDRASDAKWLQRAIWYLEGEYGVHGAAAFALAGGTGNDFLRRLALGSHLAGGSFDHTDLAPWTVANIAAAEALQRPVAALNLGAEPGHNKQDQLVLWDEPFRVPDGGFTVLLLGLGLSGLAFVKRLSQKK